MKKITIWSVSLFILFISVFAGCDQTAPRDKKILVFSKTAGFRHESIATGIRTLQALGQQEGFLVDTTEDASHFNESNLAQYSAVVFLNTTGDIFNAQQEGDFERYVQAGGGFVGIHSATDTEYEWPWYGKLVGAYFNGHPNNPNVRTAQVRVLDNTNIATDSLPASYEKIDEFYNFKNINPDLKVLIDIDESSYEGGTNGDNHPMTWYHDFDGGRAFYTGFGHTDETFSEPEFLKIIKGGLAYAIGENTPLDYAKATSLRVPEENRFSKEVLDFNLDEPTEMAVFKDGRVMFLERKGAVKLYKPDIDSTIVIAQFDLHTKFEDGLMGVALDPNYEENHWVYIYYSPAGDIPKQHLSRFEMIGDELKMDSEIVVLEVPVQRDQCCHTGGSIAFGPDGHLFLSTGDDTNPFDSDGYSPSDERPNRKPWDAQRSSANTNDLRGKILRIKPEADGTYSIPEGNLFAKDDLEAKPEIYVMGCRNPYRIAVDAKTGYLYWGDVGPDAGKNSETRGPKGQDEVNQARGPGFYGWPLFTGTNQAYTDYDFQTKKAGGFFDPEKPMNLSPNNTGKQALPPAQKAMIWYSYDESEEFPLLGTGGKNPMAGPVFHADAYPASEKRFPEYMDGKMLFYEWMRGDIYLLHFDEDQNLSKVEPFMAETEFNNPMDMEFGPEGDLYMLEYGTTWFKRNMDARLVRINYTGGNRPPEVHIAADKSAGAVPLTVQFSSKGTQDHDGDDLTYSWEFLSQAGDPITDASPEFTFSAPGTYPVKLTVDDGQGNQVSEIMEIIAGNEPPSLSMQLQGNQTFYWDNQPIAYQVDVTDKEDGSLSAGGIESSEVFVRVDYHPEGHDLTLIAQGHQQMGASVANVTGNRLINESDCKACHLPNDKSIGPAYMQVAEKYKNDPTAPKYLAGKIINGGGGVWGEQAMAAHPQLTEAVALEMVQYILALGSDEAKDYLPPTGEIIADMHLKRRKKDGAYLIHAAYADKGTAQAASLTGTTTLWLRNPNLLAVEYDEGEGVQKFENEQAKVVIMTSGSYFVFKDIDLSQITALTYGGFMMGKEGKPVVSIRLDALDGKELHQASLQSLPTEMQPGIFAAQAKSEIPATNGKHDLYITMTGAFEGKPLGGISNIQFHQ